MEPRVLLIMGQWCRKGLFDIKLCWSREKCSGRVVQGTKGDIKIRSMPREHGRMPVRRMRAAAIAKSQAFILVVRNDTVSNVDRHLKMIQDFQGKGPLLLISTYVTDEIPMLNALIVEKVKSHNISMVELINIDKIINKEQEQSALFANMIHALADMIPTKQEANVSDKPPAVSPPVMEVKVEKEVKKEMEVEKEIEVKKEMEVKKEDQCGVLSALERTLSNAFSVIPAA